MELELYVAPKWPKSFSQTYPSVFENFSKFSSIPSNVVVPSIDVVGIYADSWKGRLFL